MAATSPLHFVGIEMMDEASSKRKKKKRGKSLIFKKCFRFTSSGDHNGGKILASDDNLVYCDDTGNCINGHPYAKTKSSSSRGRMSSIFKAVLFDTAMKKRMPSKNVSEPTTESTTELMTEPMTESTTESTSKSPALDEKTDNNSFNKDNHNVAKVPEAVNNSSNDSSNVVSLSPETDASLAASSMANTGLQKMTERKVMSRVNSTKKKPPLPSGPRSSVKPIPKQDSEPATLNNSTSRLCFFIVLVVMVSVLLWMSFTTIETESSDLDSNQYTNVVVENEL